MRFLEISYQIHLLRPLLPTVTVDLALARLLTEHADAPDGALFETAVLDELLRWSPWEPDPPALHFFRIHAGREVDFVLHSPDRVVAIEVKSTQRPLRTAARPLSEILGTLATRGATRAASRLGLVVTRGPRGGAARARRVDGS